ncbi:MAG: hypothetical protein ACRECH_10575 [Nitrososphaerales archaeon]
MPSGDIGFVVLLVIHIASVIAWMGSSILFVLVIGPALPKLNQQSRAEFLIEVLPKLARFIQLASTSTIIAGIVLLGYVGSLDTNLLPSGLGLLLLLSGAVLGFAAFIVGATVLLPSSRKVLHILANMRESKEQGAASSLSDESTKLQDAIRGGSKAVAVLLAIVLILMVSGTYL